MFETITCFTWLVSLLVKFYTNAALFSCNQKRHHI